MKSYLTIITCIISVMMFACKKDDGEPPIKAITLSEKDSLAIVDIYNKIDGKLNLPSWNLNNSKTWEGVGFVTDHVNRQYKVVSLELLTSKSSGGLSEKIGDLDSLKLISIKGYGMRGSLPESLSKLTKLTYLYISRTNMSGELPDNLFINGNFSHIDISFNQFSGNIPSSIQKLSVRPMSMLHLNNNNFVGKIPDNIRIRNADIFQNTMLPIVLENNYFTEFSFDYLTDHTLSVLELSGNCNSGYIPQSIVDDINRNPKSITTNRYISAFWKGFRVDYGFENAFNIDSLKNLQR